MIVSVLAWQLPLQQATDLPNVMARADEYGGEDSKLPAGVADARGTRGPS